MINQVQTQSVPSTSVTDGSYPAQLGGKSGEGIVAELHGKHFTNSVRGNVFLGATLAAGVVVPFNAATLAGTFTLHNPAGSGKNIELIDLNVCQVPGTALITGLGVGFQGPLASTGGAPTSVTHSAGGVKSLKVGSGVAASGLLYTVATLTNVAIANLSPIMWLFNNVATTIITQQYTNYNFDGKVVLPPDTLCTLVNSITGTQSAAAISITWAEFPV